jgi:hypothetical protein
MKRRKNPPWPGGILEFAIGTDRLIRWSLLFYPKFFYHDSFPPCLVLAERWGQKYVMRLQPIWGTSNITRRSSLRYK